MWAPKVLHLVDGLPSLPPTPPSVSQSRETGLLIMFPNSNILCPILANVCAGLYEWP